ncbi:hypothetical protein V8G54_031593 [Vigna mungo]|uniref:Uncharacterized protein n=1 Tax=Vigna mungo TaxID=3915 RepID=A0AAQ3MKE8_VIGMU
MPVKVYKRHFKWNTFHRINGHFNWSGSNASRNCYRALANIQVNKGRFPTLFSSPTKKHPGQGTLSRISRPYNNDPRTLKNKIHIQQALQLTHERIACESMIKSQTFKSISTIYLE